MSVGSASAADYATQAPQRESEQTSPSQEQEATTCAACLEIFACSSDCSDEGCDVHDADCVEPKIMSLEQFWSHNACHLDPGKHLKAELENMARRLLTDREGIWLKRDDVNRLARTVVDNVTGDDSIDKVMRLFLASLACNNQRKESAYGLAATPMNHSKRGSSIVNFRIPPWLIIDGTPLERLEKEIAILGKIYKTSSFSGDYFNALEKMVDEFKAPLLKARVFLEMGKHRLIGRHQNEAASLFARGLQLLKTMRGEKADWIKAQLDDCYAKAINLSSNVVK